jgi:Transcriptional activator LAG-3
VRYCTLLLARACSEQEPNDHRLHSCTAVVLQCSVCVPTAFELYADKCVHALTLHNIKSGVKTYASTATREYATHAEGLLQSDSETDHEKWNDQMALAASRSSDVDAAVDADTTTTIAAAATAAGSGKATSSTSSAATARAAAAAAAAATVVRSMPLTSTAGALQQQQQQRQQQQLQQQQRQQQQQQRQSVTDTASQRPTGSQRGRSRGVATAYTTTATPAIDNSSSSSSSSSSGSINRGVSVAAQLGNQFGLRQLSSTELGTLAAVAEAASRTVSTYTYIIACSSTMYDGTD